MQRLPAPRMTCPACGRDTAWAEVAERVRLLRRHNNPTTRTRCPKHVVDMDVLEPIVLNPDFFKGSA